jgi:hypothetical protein
LVPLLTGVLRYPGRTFQCFSYYSLFSGSPGRTYFFQLDNYFLTSSQFQLQLPGRRFSNARQRKALNRWRQGY